MAGPNEDAYVDDQDGEQDRVYAALEAQVGGRERQPTEVDAFTDSFHDAAMNVTADDWSPEQTEVAVNNSENFAVPEGEFDTRMAS